MGALDRYHRQILLPGIGEAGQVRLLGSHALIVGCGALGTVIADALARAGVGTLTIVDRDTVELTNLQRQVLFDEADVERVVPKAQAAGAKLRRVNSANTVNTRVDDFSHRNAERHAEGADIILDGLDNFETRYVLNDLAVKHGLPYIYGGAVGTTGVSMTILPHPAAACSRAPTERLVRWAADASTRTPSSADALSKSPGQLLEPPSLPSMKSSPAPTNKRSVSLDRLVIMLCRIGPWVSACSTMLRWQLATRLKNTSCRGS